MTDERTIEARIYERLSKVIDPELGRSVTDLGMIAAIDAIPVEGKTNTYEVRVEVELTVEGCPLSQTITNQINGAVASYPDATLLPRIEVGSMSQDRLTQLVAGLKADRKQNPFNKPGIKTRIFAIASGKGGVGKSSVTANLAATFAALGYDTAAIDADIYGFSLPRLFGVHAQPTNLNGMLMPVTAWGVKLISIGMFAGADRAILWRGPRLQRSLEQFVENMSYYEHKGERLRIFGEGGGTRVSEQLTESLGYDVPLLAQLPLEPELRETGEDGRPAVLNEDGSLRADGIGETFRNLAESLMCRPL